MMESQQHSNSLNRREEGSSDSILYEKCVHAAFSDDPEQLSAQHDAAIRKSGVIGSWLQRYQGIHVAASGSERHLSVSPDGQRAAVVYGSSLTILTASSDFERTGSAFQEPAGRPLSHPVWSASGRLVAVSCPSAACVYVATAFGKVVHTCRARQWSKGRGGILGTAIREPGDKLVGRSELVVLSGSGKVWLCPLGGLEVVPSASTFVQAGVVAAHLACTNGALSLVTASKAGVVTLWRQHSGPGWSRGPSLDLRTPQDSRALLSLSPTASHVAVVDAGGNLRVLLAAGTTFTPMQREADKESGDKGEDAPGGSPVCDVAWWSEDAVVVARQDGRVTVEGCRGGHLLDPPLEPFQRSPKVSWRVGRRVLVLEAYLGEGGEDEGKEERGRGGGGGWLWPLLSPQVAPAGDATRGWRLTSILHRTPAEMLHMHVARGEYEAALQLAARAGLDTESVYKAKWQQSDKGEAAQKDTLSCVRDLPWALGECLTAHPESAEGAGGLLRYGLHLTQQARPEAISAGGGEEVEEERLWGLRLLRLRVLQYAERLETYRSLRLHRFSAAEYYAFRTEPLLLTATRMAVAGKVDDLELLLRRHLASLAPHVLTLLDCLPETLEARKLASVLPHATPPSASASRRPDWVETAATLAGLREGRGGSWLKEQGLEGGGVEGSTEEVVRLRGGRDCGWPSGAEVEAWYWRRAMAIEAESGQIELSIAVVDSGIQRGFRGLAPLLQDLMDLHAVVYEGGEEDMHLGAWQALCVYDQFCVLLRGVEEESVGERMTRQALPFLYRHPPADPREVVPRWLLEEGGAGRVGVCAAVLRECGSKVVGNRDQVAQLGLACAYACPTTHQWVELEELIECVRPPRHEGGAFPRPSVEVGQVSGPERLLDVAVAHIRAGRLLAKYEVPIPLSFFQEKAEDCAALLPLLRRLLSNFVRLHSPPTEREWAGVWGEVCTLPTLHHDTLLAELCRCMLRAGAVHALPPYLHTQGLPADKAEQLVLTAARHHFYSAHALDSEDVERARACLALLPGSLRGWQEGELFSAVVTTLPSLGVEVLPKQVRQVADRMELIHMALAAAPHNYHRLPDLLHLACQLGLKSPEEQTGVQAAAAREAAAQGDMEQALAMCRVLIERGHAPIWDLCAALGRGPPQEGLDCEARKNVVGFALAHCDQDSLAPLLATWHQLDMAARCAELAAAAHVDAPSLQEEEALMCQQGSRGEEEGREALSRVCGSRQGGVEEWRGLPKELRTFACLHLPWLLSFRPPSTPPPPSDAPFDVMRGQVAALILHALASCQVAASDQLVLNMAATAMEEGLQIGEGREGDIVGLGYLLHASDPHEAARLLEEEARKRAEGEGEEGRRGLLMALFHAALQAVLGQAQEAGPQAVREVVGALPWEVVERAVGREEGGEWAALTRRLGSELRASEDARLLEEVLPGVQLQRFALRDEAYILERLVALVSGEQMGLADTLNNALLLASNYGVDTWQVVMAHVEALLCSDWSTDSIETEVAKCYGPTTSTPLLARPLDALAHLQGPVYRHLDGTRHALLAYFFQLLAEGYGAVGRECEGEVESSLPSDLFPGGAGVAQRQTVLRAYETACLTLGVPDLDFKQVARWEGATCPGAMAELARFCTPENVDDLASLANQMAALAPPAVPHASLPSAPALYFHLVTSMVGCERYDACRPYLDRLLPPHLLTTLHSLLSASCTSERPEGGGRSVLATWEAVLTDFLALLEPPLLSSLNQVGAILQALVEVEEEGGMSGSQAVAVLGSMLPIGGGKEVEAALEAMIGCGVQLAFVLQLLEGVRGPWEAPKANPKAEPHGAPKRRARGGGGKLGVVRLSQAGQGESEREEGEGTEPPVLPVDLQPICLRVVEGERVRNVVLTLAPVGGGGRRLAPGYAAVLRSLRSAVWVQLQQIGRDEQRGLGERVRSLEVVQEVAPRSGGVWGRWVPLAGREAEEEGAVTPSLVYLKTAEVVSALWPTVQVAAGDVETAQAAGTLFLHLLQSASGGEQEAALLRLLTIWGDEFEGSVGEEQGVHALHRCWAGLLPCLLQAGGGEGVLRVLDRGAWQKGRALLTEEESVEIVGGLKEEGRVGMGGKVGLLSPYPHLRERAVEEVRRGADLDDDMLALLLASKSIPVLAAHRESEGVMRRLLEGLSPLIRQLQEHRAAEAKAGPSASWQESGGKVEGGEEDIPLFAVALPGVVSQLAMARQYGAAAKLVFQYQRTHSFLGLWGGEEAPRAVDRYLQQQMRRLREGRELWSEGLLPPALKRGATQLPCTVRQVRNALPEMIDEALSMIAEDAG